MSVRKLILSLSAAAALLAGLFADLRAADTIATFSTTLGDFDVVLYDDLAPVTVENFVRYAESGRFDSTLIHRSTTYNPLDLQILQGGSFNIFSNTIGEVVLDPPIPLEAGLPHLRGTIAMARLPDPDSATSGWFFNVRDNPGINVGPGYAVFGHILGGGLSVLDALAAVRVYNASAFLGSDFDELPLLGPSLATNNLLRVSRVTTKPFRVTAARRDESGFTLEWTALSTNTPVRVDRNTNLATGPWDPVATNITTGTFTDSAPPPGGAFYRVVIP